MLIAAFKSEDIA